jgi:hypothetical protein
MLTIYFSDVRSEIKESVRGLFSCCICLFSKVLRLDLRRCWRWVCFRDRDAGGLLYQFVTLAWSLHLCTTGVWQST